MPRVPAGTASASTGIFRPPSKEDRRGATEFSHDLVTRVPWLLETYTEHLQDHSTLLPHVLMGDITRVVVAYSGDAARKDVLTILLAHLESALKNGSDEVRDLIVTSFVENLTGETVALRSLRPLMGAALLAAVDTGCGE
jgi:hypothetical protein